MGNGIGGNGCLLMLTTMGSMRRQPPRLERHASGVCVDLLVFHIVQCVTPYLALPEALQNSPFLLRLGSGQ